MGELGVDFALCLERVGESRFNVLTLIERAGELRLELTLACECSAFTYSERFAQLNGTASGNESTPG